MTDLKGVWRIHSSEFVGEVADEFKDLQDWLIEAAKARKSGQQRFEEFLLCVKADREVLGYLFAQYYFSSKLVFISYLQLIGPP